MIAGWVPELKLGPTTVGARAYHSAVFGPKNGRLTQLYILSIVICTVDGERDRFRHFEGRWPTDVSPNHGADQAAHRRRRLGTGRGNPVDSAARRRAERERDHRQARLPRARA